MQDRHNSADTSNFQWTLFTTDPPQFRIQYSSPLFFFRLVLGLPLDRMS